MKLPKKLSPTFLSCNCLCFAGTCSTSYLLQVIQHLTKSLQIIPGGSQGGLVMCSWITTVSYQVVSINFFLIYSGALHCFLLPRLLLPAREHGPALSMPLAAGELPHGSWCHGITPWPPCRASPHGCFSPILYDALPYMGVQGPWLKLSVKNKNKIFRFYLQLSFLLNSHFSLPMKGDLLSGEKKKNTCLSPSSI